MVMKIASVFLLGLLGLLGAVSLSSCVSPYKSLFTNRFTKQYDSTHMGINPFLTQPLVQDGQIPDWGAIRSHSSMNSEEIEPYLRAYGYRQIGLPVGNLYP